MESLTKICTCKPVSQISDLIDSIQQIVIYKSFCYARFAKGLYGMKFTPSVVRVFLGGH